MRLFAKTSTTLMIWVGLLMAGFASPALAAGVSDFEGVWDTIVAEVNAHYRLYLHAEGNKIVGNFVNHEDAVYNGTLSGVVKNGRFQYSYMQPEINAVGAGYFTIGPDGTITGFTHSGSNDKQYRWEGKRIATEATAPGDIHTGNFGSTWCGAGAVFEVQKRLGDTWRFDGMIRILDTGEYDEITIEQYDDNHLLINRLVPGVGTQSVETKRPKTLADTSFFHADSGRGPGCNNLGATTDIAVPNY